ncbi:MAG: cell division protein FtsZ [Bacteroidales bacterium]
MIKFDLPKNQSSIIKVLGVGGGGSNAVNHMFTQGIEGVDFIVCNTDSQALDLSPVPNKIQLGVSLTEGRGAGSIPEIGKNAAIEDIENIRNILNTNTKMVFITAGMGGGTGTGAAPIIAQAAKEMGILTVGIITIPFSFEGRKRRQQADEGLKELKQQVDALIVISNDKLRELYGNLSVSEAFCRADNVLTTAAKGIAEIITLTGGVNVDFADVKTVMSNSGVAIMGSGSAEGENRAIRAVEEAMSSPLLNDNDINGAEHILLNITSGKEELLMDEITEITDYILMESGSTADIIWGYGRDEALGNKINVILVATGFGENNDLGYSERRPAQKVVRNLEEKQETKVQQEVQEPANGMRLVTRTPQPEGSSPEKAPQKSTPQNNTIEFEVKSKPATKKPGMPASWNMENAFEGSHQQQEAPPAVTHLSESDLQQKIMEREQRLRELSMKLKTSEGLQDLEKQPAFVRRKVELNKVQHSSESQVSRYTLFEDEEKKTQIKSNNSFLHDNVD